MPPTGGRIAFTGTEPNPFLTFSQWSKKIFTAACSKFDIDVNATSNAAAAAAEEAGKMVQPTLTRAGEEEEVCNGLRQLHKKEVLDCSVRSVELLTGKMAR